MHEPSSTAVLIARSGVLAEFNPTLRPLLAQGAVEKTRQLLATDRSPPWFDLAQRYSWVRWLLDRLEVWVLPGIQRHYLARKRWIEAEVRRALADGADQLVVLGAGLDTLAWRLCEEHLGQLHSIEVDHPATQGPKRKVFAQARAGHTPELRPADLARAGTLTDALAATPAYRRDRPSVFVAEGLLMYFPPARVATLLEELAHAAAPGSRLIFTFMEAQPVTFLTDLLLARPFPVDRALRRAIRGRFP